LELGFFSVQACQATHTLKQRAEERAPLYDKAFMAKSSLRYRVPLRQPHPNDSALSWGALRYTRTKKGAVGALF
jgi:hypothetical protein